MILFYILAAVILVSLISLIGIFLIGLNTKKLKEITHLLVSLAIGAMLGGAFLHIIPEMAEKEQGLTPYLLILVGIILFFIIEKYFNWRHCHETGCKTHAVAHLNLFGDAMHNFMDGMTISASFLINVDTGIAATVAIAIHEIPQEMGDFGVLIHSGLSKGKALLYNFISALSAVVGALIVYFFSVNIGGIELIIMPLAAGGFIYMAGTDLMPTLHREKMGNTFAQLIMILIGIGLMWALKVYVGV